MKSDKRWSYATSTNKWARIAPMSILLQEQNTFIRIRDHQFYQGCHQTNVTIIVQLHSRNPYPVHIALGGLDSNELSQTRNVEVWMGW